MSGFKYVRRLHHQSPKAGLIFCCSSYELRAALLLDADKNVLTYKSQICFIKSNGKKRYADFLVFYKENKKVIEVKPLNRVHLCEDQIADNKKWADDNNYDFSVWTEINLGFKNGHQAQKWADEYLTKITGIDHVAARKEMNLKKAKRFYNKHIAIDKIEVYCDFCKETHMALRLTYDKNIKRNGRYICEKEGGHIAGSKPKKKKENPYATDGKKKCNKCGDVKLFAEFGDDKTKSDGKSTRCKKCRAEVAILKYHNKKSTNSNK